MRRALRIGSLCTGYAGLDMAVMMVFGSQLAWCADNDRHVSKVLAVRYPNVPNLGDITTLDWATVSPVEIICAGFPCQDISYAGSGAGIQRGTRSGIWINIVAGIRTLRPSIVIVENVAALRRRGIDRVLGDLAQCGYDAIWTSLRASDVGAPHRRERVFILAFRPEGHALLAAANARCQRRPGWSVARHTASRRSPSGPKRLGHLAVPGPADGSHCSTKAEWGQYEPAIRRWEAITGRSAPAPSELGTRGQTRLAAVFSEWLMGLPRGFVTELDLPYGATHRVLGNGVVPQQAEATLRGLVSIAVQAEFRH